MPGVVRKLLSILIN